MDYFDGVGFDRSLFLAVKVVSVFVCVVHGPGKEGEVCTATGTFSLFMFSILITLVFAQLKERKAP